MQKNIITLSIFMFCCIVFFFSGFCISENKTTKLISGYESRLESARNAEQKATEELQTVAGKLIVIEKIVGDCSKTESDTVDTIKRIRNRLQKLEKAISDIQKTTRYRKNHNTNIFYKLHC